MKRLFKLYQLPLAFYMAFLFNIIILDLAIILVTIIYSALK